MQKKISVREKAPAANFGRIRDNDDFANFYFFEQKKVRFLTKFFSKADNWIMPSFAKTITVADRKIARRLLLSLKPREVLRWKKILFKLLCLLGNRTRL